MPNETNLTPQNPTAQPPLEPLKHKHLLSKIWLPILVVVALAGAYLFVAGAYSIWPFQNDATSTSPQPSPSPGEGELAGWKTYRNEDMGFELTFSDAWRGYKAMNIENGVKFSVPSVGLPNVVDVDVFLIKVIPKQEWDARGEFPPGRFLAEKDNKVYVWNSTQDPAGIPFQNIIAETQKILSTFKFIEPISQADTANWKTYRNAEYGFEVKYPVDWTMHFENTVINSPEEKTGYIFISGLKNPSNLSLMTFLKEKDKEFAAEAAKDTPELGYPGFLNFDTAKQINIDGSVAYKFVGLNFEISDLAIRAGSKVLVFRNFIIPENKITSVEADKIFDQILSTFKFTK